MGFKKLKKIDKSTNNKKNHRSIFSILSRLIFFGLIFFVVVSVVTILYFSTKIPSPEQLSHRDLAQATKIYDRNGVLLYNIFANQNRTTIPLSQISVNLQHATIAVEDKNFYHSEGFDIVGISRALFELVTTRHIEGGGSTITQQLVKNALLNSSQTLTRKIKELILAIEVERIYSKDQILDMYLNDIPYGGTAYGIEAASNLYFGIHAKDLDLAQAALLAGLPQAPSIYSPYGTHPELAKVRQKEVLTRMVAAGYITQKQADAAYNEKLVFRTSKSQIGFKAPHFVTYVKQQLINQFGQKTVEEGGLDVTTTLDYNIESQAEQIVRTEVDKLKAANVGNGAAVIIDPKTGEILAMVGSKDYFGTATPAGCETGVNCTFEPDFNAALALRQPGSSTKPITYALALEKNYTAATVLEDVQTQFDAGAGQPPYIPHDYDLKFRGPVQVRYALGNSLNVPAVKMLAYVGVKNVMSLAYKMGMKNWDPTPQNISEVGLSLVLGGRETTLLDLTDAYTTFADQGYHHNAVSILKVTDSSGKVLFDYHPTQGQKLLDPGAVFIISNILSDNGARTMEFGPNSVLNVPGHTVAVKTGTTNDKRDNWTVGYTPSVVVGVWVGNNDDAPMNPVIASGITGASPIWNKIISAYLKGKPEEKFTQPSNVIQMDIDGLMGGTPVAGSPTRKEYFIKGTEPTGPSPAYQNKKVCNNNPHRLAGPNDPGTNKNVIVLQETDPTGANTWQDGINQWVLTSSDPRFVGTAVGCSNIPNYSSGNGGAISITNIANGANVPPVFDVLASVNSPAGVKKVTWMIDGSPVKVETSGPYALHVQFPKGDQSSHTITATLEDNSGATYSTSVGVTVALQ